MKKNYLSPSMVEVALQQQGLICESVRGVDGNIDLHFVGSDADYVSGGGDIRTKDFKSLWDNEW